MKEEQSIVTENKDFTLANGLVVTVKDQTIEIPQPPQTLDKESLLRQKYIAQIDLDRATKEVERINELLLILQ